MLLRWRRHESMHAARIMFRRIFVNINGLSVFIGHPGEHAIMRNAHEMRHWPSGSLRAAQVAHVDAGDLWRKRQTCILNVKSFKLGPNNYKKGWKH